MWTWDVDKVNCIHKLKIVEDLRIFVNITFLLVDEKIRSTPRIAKRLGLGGSTLERYRLQGRVCKGGGGWCSGDDCLGRFGMWTSDWVPVKRGFELVDDHHNNHSEAGMLKISLKTIPHFFEFCEILSHGAHIVPQGYLYHFRIFQREKKAASLNNWQLASYVNKRLRKRFEKVSVPYENIDQFVLWGKTLGIIQKNLTFGRLEFNVKMFEQYLDKKNIYTEFNKDREIMEG